MTTRVFRRLVALSVVLAAAIFAPAVSFAEESSSASGGRMAAVLQPFVDSHTLAGAVVLVADKNKVLDVEAVGYADLAAKKPMQTDCVFWIASQSKPITAAALMMLVDEGKVKLDDPVEKYLPEFKGQMVVAERDKEHVLLRKPKHPITVRNVLSHTSGLPFASPIEKPTLDLFPLECRVRSYAMLPLEFEPDSKNQYANAGINTAGRIIEVVSGMPYEKFLDERLFKPLGMKDTTFWPTGEQIQRLAKAYKPAKGGLEECRIEQLKYPLGRSPAAADAGGRPVLDGGRRLPILPDDRQRRRLRRQTHPFRAGRPRNGNAATGQSRLRPGHVGIDGNYVGHGGAYCTDSRFEKKHGLIMIFLVQHAGWPKGGEKILGEFQKAAIAAFAPRSP